MSTPNPLIPQGSNPNTPRVKSNIKIAIVSILAIHLVLFGGLLLQGCKRDNQKLAAEPANALPNFDPAAFANQPAAPQPTTATPGQPALPPPGATPAPPNLVATPMPAQPGVAAPAPAEPPPAAAGAPSEYIVKKGDSFEAIAKANGTTTKAIAAANPGVDSRRMKIGQKLVLPPPTATATASASPAPAEAMPPGTEIYSVKSGDTLTRIANHYKTSVKALRAANNLKTDQIRVGQKLKIRIMQTADVPPAVLPQPVTPSGAPAPTAPASL